MPGQSSTRSMAFSCEPLLISLLARQAPKALVARVLASADPFRGLDFRSHCVVDVSHGPCATCCTVVAHNVSAGAVLGDHNFVCNRTRRSSHDRIVCAGRRGQRSAGTDICGLRAPRPVGRPRGDLRRSEAVVDVGIQIAVSVFLPRHRDGHDRGLLQRAACPKAAPPRDDF